MRVLYVSHTAHVGGAEESLLDLVRALPGGVEPVAATPRGPLWDRLGAAGVERFELAATDGSLRLHWLRTPRALGQLARAGLSVRRLATRIDAGVVHANSIRAGLAVALAGGARKPIVHVRDCLPPGRVSRLTYTVIGRRAAMVLANSRYTASRISPAPHAELRVVHPGVDLDRFDPARIDRAEARARIGLSDRDTVLAVVGQLTPWKGQDHAIRVLERLGRKQPGVRLILAGSAKFTSRATRYDNLAYVRELHGLTAALEVTKRVSFAGEIDDVPGLLRAADVALVPSIEEPFGRAATEALAMEVPVVATSVGGPAELIRDGEDGFLVEPRDLDGWVEAVSRLASDPELRTEMGRRGRDRVARSFSMRRHVDAVVEAYSALARAGSPRPPSVIP